MPDDDTRATAEMAGGATNEPATDDTSASTANGAGEPGGDKEPGSASGSARGDGFDLRSVVKQFTQPMLESLDARLREQVEVHADDVLQQKVDAAVTDRLSTVDRAIADLSRAVEALERRVEALERGGEPLDLE